MYACDEITGCGATAAGAVSGAASCADAAVTAVVAVDDESLVSRRARVARGRAGQHEGAAAVARRGLGWKAATSKDRRFRRRSGVDRRQTRLMKSASTTRYLFNTV